MTNASPRTKTVPFLAAARSTATSPEPLAANSSSSGGDSADAAPVASGPAAVVPRRESRLAKDDVAAAPATPVDRQQPRLMTLDGPAGYNVPLLLLTLLLAIVFAAGLGYRIRRELRGSPITEALRRRPPPRASRRRPNVQTLQSKRPLPDRRLIRASTHAHLDIARKHAMTKEKAFARGLMELRSYAHATRAPLASIGETAYDRARRFRTTVSDRLRPLVAGGSGRRR
jgi:hypothetical protein